jgi:hypothetical protein
MVSDELEREIREAAARAERWDQQATEIRSWSDDRIETVRSLLRQLIEDLEALRERAVEAAPNLAQPGSVVDLALRKTRMMEVLAMRVRQSRMPLLSAAQVYGLDNEAE